MTFYFYDLETSGFSPRDDRIMQFAGQRTDANLKPVGEPDNVLIKLTPDVLPQPDAVLVTGITPQKTLSDGMTEAEFCHYFIDKLALPDTCFVGYNNIRFDNDFIRFTLWRNFHDAYEWSWKENRSTWDLLDVTRMTRALRPDGIKWPFASDGKPSNQLELLASLNKLSQEKAHDALSDVLAVIDLARLIKTKQPKLFDYLLSLRNKTNVASLVNTRQPVIYVSGRYPSEFEKTTIAVMVGAHPERGSALMYDLRIDPEQFKDFSPAELAKLWQARGDKAEYFPVKLLHYNKCPAIAGDLRVINKETQARLQLHMEIINNHFEKLKKHVDFGDKLISALEIIKKADQQVLIVDELKVDASLYSGFINEADKIKSRVVRAADENTLADLSLDFSDERLKLLLPLYKARNFPKSLTAEEQQKWEMFKFNKLTLGGEESLVAKYFSRIVELSTSAHLSAEAKYLLEELKLYGELITPLEA